jgi:ATP-binding protein involved in chromosome partitioning
MFRTKTHSANNLKQAVTLALSTPEWLESVHIGERGEVTLIIHADPENLAQAESRRLLSESTVRAIEGVTSVNAVLTAERTPAIQAAPDGKTRHVLNDTTRRDKP